MATVATGIFGHGVLVRTFESSTSLNLENSVSGSSDELILDRVIHEPSRLAILTVCPP